MLSRLLSAQMCLSGGAVQLACDCPQGMLFPKSEYQGALWAGDGPGAPCSLQRALLVPTSGDG